MTLSPIHPVKELFFQKLNEVESLTQKPWVDLFQEAQKQLLPAYAITATEYTLNEKKIHQFYDANALDLHVRYNERNNKNALDPLSKQPIEKLITIYFLTFELMSPEEAQPYSNFSEQNLLKKEINLNDPQLPLSEKIDLSITLHDSLVVTDLSQYRSTIDYSLAIVAHCFHELGEHQLEAHWVNAAKQRGISQKIQTMIEHQTLCPEVKTKP